MTPSAVRRHSPPPPLRRLQLHTDNEPVYAEISPPVHVTNRPPEAGDMVDSGQFVVVKDPRLSSTDNLRQVIKDNITSPSSKQTLVERPRRWSVAVSSEHGFVSPQLQVFDDVKLINGDVVGDPVVPATRPPDDADKSAPSAHTDSVSRSVSSGRLTSSSSDDVTTTLRKSSSALAAATSTLKRAFCGRKDKTANESPHQARLASASSQQVNSGPPTHGDNVQVTSHTSNDVVELNYDGGKVTHF